MTNIPTTLPVKKNKMRKSEPQKSQPPDTRQLIHEVFNQITVMNLCCFKFRNAVASFIDPQLLSDIERMEKAVADLAALVESFPPLNTSAPTAGNRTVPPHLDPDPVSPTPANVYALFNSTRR